MLSVAAVMFCVVNVINTDKRVENITMSTKVKNRTELCSHEGEMTWLH